MSAPSAPLAEVVPIERLPRRNDAFAPPSAEAATGAADDHLGGGFSPRGDEDDQHVPAAAPALSPEELQQQQQQAEPSPVDLDRLADSRIPMPFSATQDDRPPPLPAGAPLTDAFEFGANLIVSFITWNMAGKTGIAPARVRDMLVPTGHIMVYATQENGPYVGTNAAHEAWEQLVVAGLNKGAEEQRVQFVAMQEAAQQQATADAEQRALAAAAAAAGHQQRSTKTPETGVFSSGFANSSSSTAPQISPMSGSTSVSGELPLPRASTGIHRNVAVVRSPLSQSGSQRAGTVVASAAPPVNPERQLNMLAGLVSTGADDDGNALPHAVQGDDNDGNTPGRDVTQQQQQHQRIPLFNASSAEGAVDAHLIETLVAEDAPHFGSTSSEGSNVPAIRSGNSGEDERGVRRRSSFSTIETVRSSGSTDGGDDAALKKRVDSFNSFNASRSRDSGPVAATNSIAQPPFAAAAASASSSQPQLAAEHTTTATANNGTTSSSSSGTVQPVARSPQSLTLGAMSACSLSSNADASRAVHGSMGSIGSGSGSSGAVTPATGNDHLGNINFVSPTGTSGRVGLFPATPNLHASAAPSAGAAAAAASADAPSATAVSTSLLSVSGGVDDNHELIRKRSAHSLGSIFDGAGRDANGGLIAPPALRRNPSSSSGSQSTVLVPPATEAAPVAMRPPLRFTYEKIASVSMMACNLVVVARSDVAKLVGRVNVGTVKTGAGGLIGNKGGICVEFSLLFPDAVQQHCDDGVENRRRPSVKSEDDRESLLFRRAAAGLSGDGIDVRRTATRRPVDGVSFGFVCAHLAPHEPAVQERNDNFFTILRDLAVGSKGGFARECRPPPPEVQVRNASDEFDLFCFGGDLNYRIDGNKEAVDRIIHLHGGLRAVLAHNDQLLKQLRTSKQTASIFRGFREGPLTFRPTYKYRIDGKDDGGGEAVKDKNKKMIHAEEASAVALPPPQAPLAIRAVSSRDSSSPHTSPPAVVGGGDDAAAGAAAASAVMSDYDRGKKNRLPSYTDRVLYKRHQHYRYPLHLLYYHDFRDVTVSDHKPVLAMLAVGTPFAAEVKKHLAERRKMDINDGSGGGMCGCCG